MNHRPFKHTVILRFSKRFYLGPIFLQIITISLQCRYLNKITLQVPVLLWSSAIYCRSRLLYPSLRVSLPRTSFIVICATMATDLFKKLSNNQSTFKCSFMQILSKVHRKVPCLSKILSLPSKRTENLQSYSYGHSKSICRVPGLNIVAHVQSLMGC